MAFKAIRTCPGNVSPGDLSPQDQPFVASGTLAGGEWKILSGREKIYSVGVEIDKRQVGERLVGVGSTLGDSWMFV